MKVFALTVMSLVKVDVLFTVTIPPKEEVPTISTFSKNDECPWTASISLICIFPANEDSPSLLMITFDVAPSLILKELKQSMVSLQLTLATSRKPANDALPVCVIAMLLTSSASYIIKLCPWMKVFASTVMLPPNEDVPPTSKLFSICIKPLKDDVPPTSSAWPI